MQPWHWIVLIVVVVILFGSKKLPDAARGLGRSLRIFKSEMGEMTKEGKDAAAAPVADTPAPPQRELPPSEAASAADTSRAQDRADS